MINLKDTLEDLFCENANIRKAARYNLVLMNKGIFLYQQQWILRGRKDLTINCSNHMYYDDSYSPGIYFQSFKHLLKILRQRSRISSSPIESK